MKNIDHYLNRILEYAEKNYQRMFREPDGYLKYQFLVPGSCYDNCLWDWDSWLTNIALRQFVTRDISDYEKGCIINYLEYQDDEGMIHSIAQIHVQSRDMKYYCGIPIHEYRCSTVAEGQEYLFRLYYYAEENRWKIRRKSL